STRSLKILASWSAYRGASFCCIEPEVSTITATRFVPNAKLLDRRSETKTNKIFFTVIFEHHASDLSALILAAEIVDGLIGSLNSIDSMRQQLEFPLGLLRHELPLLRATRMRQLEKSWLWTESVQVVDGWHDRPDNAVTR